MLQIRFQNLPIRLATPDIIQDIADEQPDIVERIVQRVCNPRCQFSNARQFGRLDQLCLFFLELASPFADPLLELFMELPKSRLAFAQREFAGFALDGITDRSEQKRTVDLSFLEAILHPVPGLPVRHRR